MPRGFESPRDFVERAASWLYRRSIRGLVPVKRPVLYAGVAIHLDYKYGDSRFSGKFLRGYLADVPDYEAALVQGLKMSVRPGMTVLIVGTGLGVTAVIAARLVGPGGKVVCYEGSRINVDLAREAARRNGVENRMQVHHAIVGPAIGVYHDDTSAPAVPVADLPECDVLELDCEGSERQILHDLQFQPRHILVETHGLYGSPTTVVAGLLRDRGYVVTDLGLAEPRFATLCTKGDVHVLVAEREGQQ